MDKDQLQAVLEKHKPWLESGGEEGQRANLQGADLRGADLRGADLQGANLAFSCLPLWCGSLCIKADRRLVAQIAFHLAALDVSECEDAEVRDAMAAFRAMPMAMWFKQYRSDV